MSLIQLADGTTRRLGRKRSVARGPRLQMSRYMTGALPAPPASVDYSPAAHASLSQMYGNDTLGDCVIACMAHLVGVFTGNSGSAPVVFTQPQIISLYSAIGGYVPGHPSTDNGCNEQDALAYWQNHGAPSGQHQIAGWVAVNPLDANEVKTALWLFENLMFGIELPDAWTRVTGSGFTWDAGTPDPENGHCVGGFGYSSAGIGISTWGLTGTMTWQALARDVIARSGGELYAVVSHDAVNRATNKAPNGFDWASLVSDFDAIGGHVPVPSPAPPAPVPPAPTPTPAPQNPTKAQVLSAIDTALSSLSTAGWTKARVVSGANDAINKLHWVK